MLIQCAEINDLNIESPFETATPFDKINVHSFDPFDSPIPSIMISANSFNQSMSNEEFNDSLESQPNDFNTSKIETRPPEPSAVEQDSLESIDNNTLVTTNTFGATANSSNSDEILVPIQSNENNEITNPITETNITKSIDTECNNDSEDYDFKDIPGIEIANQRKRINKFINYALFIIHRIDCRERTHEMEKCR